MTPGSAGALARQRRAVLVLFFANGATFSSWLPRVPEVRDRLGLSLGTLGLVLLGIGLGGLLSSAAAGLVVDRVGSRRGAVVSTVVLGGGLVSIGLAPTALTLGVALVALSAVDALADIAMNVQATDVQRRSGRSVMQRFHAGWSVGAVTGAAIGATAAAIGVSLAVQLAVTGAILAIGGLAARTSLAVEVEIAAEPIGEGRRVPVLVLLAALALAVAVVEGTPGDWAAVFGSDVHDTSEGVAALGYVAAAGGMVAGRLGGDRATDWLGGQRLFVSALLTVAFGLAVVVSSPAVWIAIAGFVAVGVGVSVLFPALYLEAATTPGVPSGLGLGVMTTGARVGFLLSPVVVGALSEATSLRAGLAAVIGTATAASLVLGGMLRQAAGR
ncbi:MAG: MFS transporter [Acidimicrobiales bacterium]